jgi:hypothetical protein
MEVTNMQELPINDFLRDGMLLKVTDSNPWYANIVNFMVTGYVPPGENKKSYKSKTDVTFRMTHTCTGCVLMDC